MAKPTINNTNHHDKLVFVRVDYNVPITHTNDNTTINDTTRIQATIPTLDLLIKQGAKIILATHLGRPNGKPNPLLSLRPIAKKLADLIARPIAFADNCISQQAQQTANALKPGDILLLENLRFHPQEQTNDPHFATQLAGNAQAYINDAFGTAHRAHASTVGVPKIITQNGGTCLSGLLIQRELKFLHQELQNPTPPFTVILGGAKVSDKITLINRLIEKAQTLLIGGAMAYTFKLAQGHKTGKSLIEPDKTQHAQAALQKATQRGTTLLLPTDNTIATPHTTTHQNKTQTQWHNPQHNTQPDIPPDQEGVDIGPQTIQTYTQHIHKAKTILWNGPMGIFEDPRFAKGTHAIAQAVAHATQTNHATSIIGGGDSIKALRQTQLHDKVTFMSTGGGATLQYLEGKTLPGIAALHDKP